MSRTYRRNVYNKYNKMEKQIWDKDGKNRKVDRSCLNNGGCSWCENGRLHKHRKRELSAKEEFETIGTH